MPSYKLLSKEDWDDFEATPGIVLYIPANVVHAVKATLDSDGVFFTAKDASYGLPGVKAG